MHNESNNKQAFMSGFMGTLGVIAALGSFLIGIELITMLFTLALNLIFG